MKIVTVVIDADGNTIVEITGCGSDREHARVQQTFLRTIRIALGVQVPSTITDSSTNTHASVPQEKHRSGCPAAGGFGDGLFGLPQPAPGYDHLPERCFEFTGDFHRKNLGAGEKVAQLNRSSSK